MEAFANDDDSGKVGKVHHCGVDKILLSEDAFFIFTLNISYSCVAFFMQHADNVNYKLQHKVKSLTYLNRYIHNILSSYY
jgi:hypothetical protein